MCYHAVDVHCLTTYNMKRTRDAEDALAPEDVGQRKKCEQLLSQPTRSAAIPSSYLVSFPSYHPHLHHLQLHYHQEEQKESPESTAVRADPRMH